MMEIDFLDMNEYKMSLLIGSLQECYLLQQWIRADKKPNSNEEWLNVLIQKKWFEESHAGI